MGSSIAVWNGVRETENLVVVTIVILQNHVCKDVVFSYLAIIIYFDFSLSLEHDWVCVHKRFVFTQLNNEFFDPARVEKGGSLCAFRTLVDKVNCEPGIQEGQLTEAVPKPAKIECDRINENRRVGKECDRCACFPGTSLTHDFERFRSLSSLKSNRIYFFIPCHCGLEPIRKSINALRPHSVETS